MILWITNIFYTIQYNILYALFYSYLDYIYLSNYLSLNYYFCTQSKLIITKRETSSSSSFIHNFKEGRIKGRGLEEQEGWREEAEYKKK